jgi:2-polyprenyl-3-methyl-5-hydroxy-6-metoxy-1,4-benzoquinol methylase
MNFDWNEHYKNGGKSGEPKEYEIARSWKKIIISTYCDINVDSILDVGCGDLQFWNGDLPSYYTGIDISQVIIDKNKLLYPDKKFICSNASTTLDVSADAVICFDMLWHIIDDNDYIKILENIKKYSKNYVFLYTWNSNIFDKNIFYRLYANFKQSGSVSFKPIDNDGGYQKYRDFLKIALPIFNPEFTLIASYKNTHWTEGTMYVFAKPKLYHVL